jgi:hypothetical protein
MQPISRVVWRAWKIRHYKIISGLWEPHGFRDTIIPDRLEQMNWRYFFRTAGKNKKRQKIKVKIELSRPAVLWR